ILQSPKSLPSRLRRREEVEDSAADGASPSARSARGAGEGSAPEVRAGAPTSRAAGGTAPVAMSGLVVSGTGAAKAETGADSGFAGAEATSVGGSGVTFSPLARRRLQSATSIASSMPWMDAFGAGVFHRLTACLKASSSFFL